MKLEDFKDKYHFTKISSLRKIKGGTTTSAFMPEGGNSEGIECQEQDQTSDGMTVIIKLKCP